MKRSLLTIITIYVTSTWIVWSISILFNIESVLALIAIWIITAMNVTALTMFTFSYMMIDDHTSSQQHQVV